MTRDPLTSSMAPLPLVKAPMITHFVSTRQPDPLVPLAALLPLCNRSGGQLPVPSVPGGVRPVTALLAVVPVECGRHDTTASRWYEDDPTQKSADGNVVPDTVKVLRTDT